MPGAIPIVEDMPGAVPSMFSVAGGATVAGAEATVGGAIGPNEAGAHNTHLWVAGVMLIALALIVFLHVSGFRFTTDVGITRG